MDVLAHANVGFFGGVAPMCCRTGANGSRALFDEQEAAGDPASDGTGNRPVTSPYMEGWVAWQYPGDRSTRDPTQNGGVQALIDLKAIHAVSDIWMNHFSGNAWARLEIFLRSPFDAEPVWSADINNSQVNGVPVNEPPVCNGWVRMREPAASLFMLLATSFGIPVERTRNLPTVPG